MHIFLETLSKEEQKLFSLNFLLAEGKERNAKEIIKDNEVICSAYGTKKFRTMWSYKHISRCVPDFNKFDFDEK